VIRPGEAGPGSRDRTSELTRPEDAPAGTTASRRLIVPAREKDYIVKNFPKILHEVKLQTELEEDGSMSGVKVGYVKAGSVLSRIGRLRSGDIIRKVNGTPVNSIQQAVSLYEQLTKQNVQKVDVEIERKGNVFTHNYSIAGSRP
jgi:type II secretory pathway component PulC